MWNVQCCVFGLLIAVNAVTANEAAAALQNSISGLDLQANNQNLNNIVGGVRKRDPDAITYPDELLKDSYGNAIVTPFTPTNSVEIGHMTDVNKGDTIDNRDGHGDQGIKKDPLGFILPSYADGITKIETLAPNAPKFPLVPPTKPIPNNQQHQPNNQINYQQTNQQNYPIPPNNILPPFSDNDRNPYPLLEVNTQPTLVYVHQVNNNKAPGFNRAPVTPSTTTTTRLTTPRPNNANDDGVYRGTFGGAPGILGDQKTPGYAVKPTAGIPNQQAFQPPKPPVHDVPQYNPIGQNVNTQNRPNIPPLPSLPPAPLFNPNFQNVNQFNPPNQQPYQPPNLSFPQYNPIANPSLPPVPPTSSSTQFTTTGQTFSTTGQQFNPSLSPIPTTGSVPQYTTTGQTFNPSGQNFNSAGQNFNSAGQNFNSAGQTFNPTGQTFTSTGQTFNPNGQTSSPTGQTFTSTGQNFASTGQTFSPTGQTFTSTGQTFSPTGQTFTSTGQTYSPTGQNFNPTAQNFNSAGQNFNSAGQNSNPSSSPQYNPTTIQAAYPSLAPIPSGPSGSQGNDVYTGTFGGPPGVLSPNDNLGQKKRQ